MFDEVAATYTLNIWQYQIGSGPSFLTIFDPPPLNSKYAHGN